MVRRRRPRPDPRARASLVCRPGRQAAVSLCLRVQYFAPHTLGEPGCLSRRGRGVWRFSEPIENEDLPPCSVTQGKNEVEKPRNGHEASLYPSAGLHFCRRGGAEVKLPAIFSDHMVLQADAAVAVWGWAAPGEKVTVSLAGCTAATTSDAQGKWTLKLGKLHTAAKPQCMTVMGKNTLIIQDVLVGEVWLASGQSNMEMQVQDPRHGSVDHAAEEIAAADYPQIRLFVPDTSYDIYELPAPPPQPATDRAGAWHVCSPQTVGHFSAVGYFFARDLHRQLGVPVGIVSAAVGGTPIEAWTSLAAQQAEPALRPVLDDWQQKLAHYDAGREQRDFLEAKRVWLKERAEAAKKGQTPPKVPKAFKNLRVMAPGGLFNGLIAPLVPYTLAGVIWYQGDRNAAGPLTGYYGLQLQTLVRDWRSRWGDQLYFAWVQLPRFQREQQSPSEPEGWGVSVREGMCRALALPRTGMAVTIDLGGATAGHPTNKAEFARRLSLVALHDVYRQPLAEWSGPLFRSARREGQTIVIGFDHAAGLQASSGELRGFAVAGSDRKFVWAKAKIAGEQVIVWSDDLPAGGRALRLGGKSAGQSGQFGGTSRFALPQRRLETLISPFAYSLIPDGFPAI